MPNFRQRDTGDMEIVGVDGQNIGAYAFTGEWIATSVDKRFATMGRAMRVKGITACVTVAGNDAGAVTAIVRKVPSGTAIGSGTALHSGTINLKGTADTNQALTLSTTSSDLDLAAGDSLAIDFTGTLTLATGLVTVMADPR